MKLDANILKNMLRAIIGTDDYEIGCDDCFIQLDEFIELKLQGKSPKEAMPLVEDHLKRCKECRDEYEALLEALKNTGTAV